MATLASHTTSLHASPSAKRVSPFKLT
jgi:hypothetical protein